MLKKLAHLKGVCFLGAVEAKAIDRVFVFQVLQRLERGRLRPHPQQKASRHLSICHRSKTRSLDSSKYVFDVLITHYEL